MGKDNLDEIGKKGRRIRLARFGDEIVGFLEGLLAAVNVYQSRSEVGRIFAQPAFVSLVVYPVVLADQSQAAGYTGPDFGTGEGKNSGAFGGVRPASISPEVP